MGKVAHRLPLEECIARHVSPGCSLGIGGLHFHNTPMALVREVIRQERPLGLLIPPLDGSINADQLIGASLVAEVQIAYVGLELFGLAPRFRAAAEAGSVRVRDCEEAGFAFGLIAAAAGQPFASLPAGFLPEDPETPAILSVNPDDYAVIEDPFTRTRHPVVRAIAPDVAFVHCQVIDGRGNCGFLGGTFLDVELAKAAQVCVVQAEHQVDELPAACRGHLPGYAVDSFCVLEGGAHPASSHGLFGYDEEHIRRYAAAAATDEGFAAYRTGVIGVSEAHYRAAEDVPARLRALATGPAA